MRKKELEKENKQLKKENEELKDEMSNLYYHKGMDKHYAQNFHGAIADFTRAIEIDPNYADAYSGRGDSKFILRDYNGAIDDFNKVIEINPKDFWGKRNLEEAEEKQKLEKEKENE